LIGAYAVPSFLKDTMSIRFIGALLCCAAFVLTTGAFAAADKTKKKTGATTIITSSGHGLSSGDGVRQAKPKGNAKTGSAGMIVPTLEAHTKRKTGGNGTPTPGLLIGTQGGIWR
jgi:hypothetical protein